MQFAVVNIEIKKNKAVFHNQLYLKYMDIMDRLSLALKYKNS